MGSLNAKRIETRGKKKKKSSSLPSNRVRGQRKICRPFPLTGTKQKRISAPHWCAWECFTPVTSGYAHQVNFVRTAIGSFLYANGECTISSSLEWPQQDIGKYSVTIGSLTAAETADRDR